MANIGFIGLGNMGGPMAANLVNAGHHVQGFDLSAQALDQAISQGIQPTTSIAEAAQSAEIIVTMLPAGKQVRETYLGPSGIIAAAPRGALLIDCSTIDVTSARDVAKAGELAGLGMIDAPVSGGVVGAEAATLTFMVGGSELAFERALAVLKAMGKTVIHTGGSGNGQVAKVCNNMLLGISMIGVSEAFTLGQKLGLDPQKLFDVSSQSSGQCWSMTTYCPVPGPVPASPANRDYQPGFAVSMMLKDLLLAQDAAKSVDCKTPLGSEAAQIYHLFAEKGNEGVDFSAIIKMIDVNDT